MNVLVVAPHPDDETLGAGGTILKLMEQGHKVYWLLITDNATTNIVDEVIDKVDEVYGFEKRFELNLPPGGRLDTVTDLECIKKISDVVNEVKPEWIILPDCNDVHSDHREVFDWVFPCTKIFRYPFVKKVLTMEIISETNFALPEHTFSPNMFVDITEYMEKKIKIAKLYETEIHPHPFPRSVESLYALATLRGVMAGVRYAESFRILKEIV